MKIYQAGEQDFETVKFITAETIQEIYPHYYPKGAVDFFLAHHSDDHIREDICAGRVFLICDTEAVSYTHLDVYKRQYRKKAKGAPHSTEISGRLFPAADRKKAGHRYSGPLFSAAPDSAFPVS